MLSEKFSSLSSDTLKRISKREIHIRHRYERDGDVIRWSGYAVVWVQDREFIRLTPHFASYNEAVDAQTYRRFQSQPPMQPTASTYTLVKPNGRRVKLSVVNRTRRVPTKRVGFAVDNRPRFKGHDLTDNTFGKLVALSALPNTIRYGHRIWICRCACGEHIHLRATDLMRGLRTSCGCDRSKRLSMVRPATQPPELNTCPG